MFALGRSPFPTRPGNPQAFALPNATPCAAGNIDLVARLQIPNLREKGRDLNEREVALSTPLVLRQNGAIFHIMASLSQEDKNAFACTNSVHNTQVALARENPIVWEVNAGRKPLLEIMIKRREQGLLGGGCLDELISFFEKTCEAIKIKYLDLRKIVGITQEQLQRLFSLCSFDVQVFITEYEGEVIPDLQAKHLHISRCSNLHSIGNISAKRINVSRCQNLQRIVKLSQVQELMIYQCPLLSMIPPLSCTYLEIRECESTTSIGALPKLQQATIVKCKQLDAIGEYPQSANVAISDCPRLPVSTKSSSSSISQIGSSENPIPEITINGDENLEQIEEISHVKKLTITGCNLLEKIVSLSHIEELIIENCFLLKSIEQLFNVKKITVSNCRASPLIEVMEIDSDESLERVEDIPSVKKLTIKNCNALTEIGNNVEAKELAIDNCQSLSSLATVPNIEQLTVSNCPSLQGVGNSLDTLKELTINNCQSLASIAKLPNIEQLTISNCPSLKKIGAIWKITIMTTIKALFHPFENLLKVFSSPFSKIELQNCPSLNAIGQFPKWLWMGFYSIYRFFKEA